jgi:hypothetical protein
MSMTDPQGYYAGKDPSGGKRIYSTKRPAGCRASSSDDIRDPSGRFYRRRTGFLYQNRLC